MKPGHSIICPSSKGSRTNGDIRAFLRPQKLRQDPDRIKVVLAVACYTDGDVHHFDEVS
jgi:hypothetical protein